MFITAAPTWDLNKDGSVTCDEWKAYTGELFTAADGNGDKLLNQDEYRNVIKTDRLFQVADLAYFDGNKDGQLTLQEISDKPNPAFVRLDRDKDCKIGRAEIVLVRGRHPQPKKKTQTPDPTSRGP